ncbi:MAG: mechanosensitive ion channel domain-containing protein [Cyclobacteriaceae bacterium]
MNRILLLIIGCAFTFSASAQSADSLALSKGGLPVVFKKDTLFFVHSKIGPYKPADRVNTINRRITSFMKDSEFEPDSLFLLDSEMSTDIWWGDRVLFSVTDLDAKEENMQRKALAQKDLDIVKAALNKELKSKSIKNILLQAGLTILVLLIIYFLIKYINKLFVFTRRWLVNAKGRILKGIKFKGYEFLDTDRELKVALFLNSILRWVVIIIVLYLALPILFSIFPWTRGWAEKLFGYVLDPLTNVLSSIFNYIPNLFTIGVIYFVTRYVVQFIEFLAGEIEKGSLVVSGFYPDWAKPTFGIVKVLMYAFMFIVIFPYLPGSDSPVFQGVSVFLGVLFSLGSSTAISNMVAGLVITYMRPFKIGDRIKIGDLTGDVLEKSMLVTRIRTIKNEDITIPNATVLSGHTINYTTSAKDLGLILNTTVTIGYDVPWQKVHDLLIRSANDADGVIKSDDKKPFVLQTSLDDFYVAYQLNAYTHDPGKSAVTYSNIHQQIQDKFAEAGVEIMSPHFGALRDGNMVNIPANYLPKDYKAPSFNIGGLGNNVKPGS